MKAYLVRITKSAERDLNRAADYIEFSLKNLSAADSLIDEAEKTISSLSYVPERFALVDDKLLAAWGIRFVRVKSYLAFYTVSQAEHAVNVLRFLYGKSDWTAILHSSILPE